LVKIIFTLVSDFEIGYFGAGQLQVEPTTGREKTKSKYRGVYQATKLLLREEGSSALWKGHIPAQGLSLLYGASQVNAPK
jgi:solute carrier family 25 (mitochondrial thiamine pyrophosphate transporter), member 19